jgi:hypothetical protein
MGISMRTTDGNHLDPSKVEKPWDNVCVMSRKFKSVLVPVATKPHPRGHTTRFRARGNGRSRPLLTKPRRPARSFAASNAPSPQRTTPNRSKVQPGHKVSTTYVRLRVVLGMNAYRSGQFQYETVRVLANRT